MGRYPGSDYRMITISGWFEIFPNHWLSLHHHCPAERQTDEELDYQGYARVQLPRYSSDWSLTDNGITNRYPIAFPPASGTFFIRYAGIGLLPTGDGRLLAALQFNTNYLVNAPAGTGFIPSPIPLFEPGTLELPFTDHLGLKVNPLEYDED